MGKDKSANKNDDLQDQRIVSSAHLVSDKGAELSEFEFGLIVASNAFSRWTVRCMNAAGLKDLTPVDVLVLHSVNHRGREKRQSDICLVLNIDDSHIVSYSLKKLSKLDLVAGVRRGKEVIYNTTEKGVVACTRYRDVREKCLIDTLASIGFDSGEIETLARMLRGLSGLYDQAARSATVL